MKRRSRGNIFAELNRVIGSTTHWALRGFIAWLSNKFGVTLPTWLERNLAYYGAGFLLVGVGVWHYLPWLPSVSFPSISFDWSIFLSIVSLALIVIQTIIIYRQLQIMEVQDELLGRRSDLTMMATHNQAQDQIDFDVQNCGRKGANDFYWDIFIPASLSNGRLLRDAMLATHAPLDTQIFNGTAYNRYSGHGEDKLYPNRIKYICNFQLPSLDTKGEFKFYWQLVGEDGIFPAKDHYGLFEITIS